MSLCLQATIAILHARAAQEYQRRLADPEFPSVPDAGSVYVYQLSVRDYRGRTPRSWAASFVQENDACEFACQLVDNCGLGEHQPEYKAKVAAGLFKAALKCLVCSEMRFDVYLVEIRGCAKGKLKPDFDHCSVQDAGK